MHQGEQNAIEIGNLISRQLQGAPLLPSEQAQLDNWLAASEDNQKTYNRFLENTERKAAFSKLDAYDSEEAFQDIRSKLSRSSRSLSIRTWLPYAAAVLLLLSAVGGWIWYGTHYDAAQMTSVPTDFTPATNKAVIELSDGRRYELDQDKNQVQFGETGISYTDGETIAHTDAIASARISTPRGGIYKIILPDGTKVMLNAGSTLSYPTIFAGTTREVELNGEAYFEVASRPEQPFIVHTEQQRTKVLGTHFNIEAYADEAWTKTTLLEGSVSIQTKLVSKPSEVVLTPGQQSIVQGSTLQAQTTNTSSELSWLNGRFDFDGKTLRQVMRELARWYDIDVVYKGEVPDIEFIGGTFRNNNISTILDMLQSSEIHYNLNAERKLIISAGDK